jgi:hypothetical protein
LKQLKLLILIILILNVLVNNNAFSQVTVVKKGDTVPYDGVLFTKEKEVELRQQAMDLEYEKKRNLKLSDLNILNEKQIDLMHKRIDLYQNRVQELQQRDINNEDNKLLNNTLYFVSGALLTGLIGYGVIQAYR